MTLGDRARRLRRARRRRRAAAATYSGFSVPTLDVFDDPVAVRGALFDATVAASPKRSAGSAAAVAATRRVQVFETRRTPTPAQLAQFREHLRRESASAPDGAQDDRARRLANPSPEIRR